MCHKILKIFYPFFETITIFKYANKKLTNGSKCLKNLNKVLIISNK